MSPTGEGTVSLSLEKVQVKRDRGRGGRWVGNGGQGPRGRRADSPGHTACLPAWPPGGWVSGLDWQPLAPPLVC